MGVEDGRGEKVQCSAAGQEHHDDDDEQETNRATTNPDATGQNRREYEMHSLILVSDGIVFAIA